MRTKAVDVLAALRMILARIDPELRPLLCMPSPAAIACQIGAGFLPDADADPVSACDCGRVEAPATGDCDGPVPL